MFESAFGLAAQITGLLCPTKDNEKCESAVWMDTFDGLFTAVRTESDSHYTKSTDHLLHLL